jgi:hypothetical protein
MSVWVTRRERNAMRQHELLSRIYVLTSNDNEQGICAVRIMDGRIVFTPVEEPAPLSLIVVDEAHHVYRHAHTRQTLQRVASHGAREGEPRLLLLSDVS